MANHAAVMPVTVAAAYFDLLPQIRQLNIGPYFSIKSFFVLARAPALGTASPTRRDIRGAQVIHRPF